MAPALGIGIGVVLIVAGAIGIGLGGVGVIAMMAGAAIIAGTSVLGASAVGGYMRRKKMKKEMEKFKKAAGEDLTPSMGRNHAKGVSTPEKGKNEVPVSPTFNVQPVTQDTKPVQPLSDEQKDIIAQFTIAQFTIAKADAAPDKNGEVDLPPPPAPLTKEAVARLGGELPPPPAPLTKADIEKATALPPLPVASVKKGVKSAETKGDGHHDHHAEDVKIAAHRKKKEPIEH